MRQKPMATGKQTKFLETTRLGRMALWAEAACAVAHERDHSPQRSDSANDNRITSLPGQNHVAGGAVAMEMAPPVSLGRGKPAASVSSRTTSTAVRSQLGASTYKRGPPSHNYGRKWRVPQHLPRCRRRQGSKKERRMDNWTDGKTRNARRKPEQTELTEGRKEGYEQIRQLYADE